MSSLLNKLTGKHHHHSSSSNAVETKPPERVVKEEAPVIKEHIRDEYQHVDQTERHEIRDRTEIETIVQPIVDKQYVGEERQVIDEGVAVREVGSAQLDEAARAELLRRREEVARQAGRTYSEEQLGVIDERADLTVTERVNVIKQVQPVIEREIERPHRVEHRKADVTIIHEPAKFREMTVAPAVTVEEYTRTKQQSTPLEGSGVISSALRRNSSSSSSSSD